LQQLRFNPTNFVSGVPIPCESCKLCLTLAISASIARGSVQFRKLTLVSQAPRRLSHFRLTLASGVVVLQALFQPIRFGIAVSLAFLRFVFPPPEFYFLPIAALMPRILPLERGPSWTRDSMLRRMAEPMKGSESTNWNRWPDSCSMIFLNNSMCGQEG
jgi:hypothetical protein